MLQNTLLLTEVYVLCLLAPLFCRLTRRKGTYVRTSALDYLVRLFFSIDMDKPKQVISLGAGSDTRYFRLRSQYPELKIHYHELDFPANTRSKIAIIRRKPSPLDLLDQNDDKLQWSSHESNHALRFSAEGDALYSPAGGYNIHPLDLRTLAAEDSVLPALPGLDPKLPTIILSEMCLCYLTPEETQAVMRSLTKSYLSSNTPVSIILYEPVRPFDAFGKVMVSNLASRQITLPTLSAYPTLSSQKRRLKEADFTSGQGAADINRVWDRWIPPEEKIRVDRCEGLDEVEEWVMLAQHYCIAWGWRDGAEKGDASGDAEAMVFSRAWRGVIGEEVDDDLPGPAHGGLRNPFKDT